MSDSTANRHLRGGAHAVDVAREVVEVLSGDRGPAALATVIGRKGSAPQALGAKLLLHTDGQQVGTVGGGAIEMQVLDACRKCLRDGKPRRVEAHLVRDLAMCCGGSMEVFVEYLQAQTRLILIGGGHVAQAVTPVAQSVGFRVHILDDREGLLEHPAFEEAQTGAYDVDEIGAAVGGLNEHDVVLIMTRDHARDGDALAYLMRQPHRYLGMIGSKRKVHAVLTRVLRKELGLGRELPDFSRMRAPIGLDLGGRTPAEIAVSIVADLIADRHGGTGTNMSILDEALAAARVKLDAGDDEDAAE